MGTREWLQSRSGDGDKDKTINDKNRKGDNVEEIEKCEAMFTALITTAPSIPGDINPLVPLSEIAWIDYSLLRNGLWFYATHFTHNMLVCSILSLMLGFAVKPLATAVHRGRLDKHDFSYSKYLKTLKGVSKLMWLPFDQARVYENYSKIRKQHGLVSKMMMKPKVASPPYSTTFSEDWKRDVAEAVKADLKHVDTSLAPTHLLTWDPKVPINQFDMAMSQFALVWIFTCFPKLFGIKNVKEELKGVLHTWAVHGRLLGIQDEYNIFIRQDYNLYEKVFRNVFLAGLKEMDETVITLQNTFIEAISWRLPFITYKAVLYIGLREVEGNKGEHLWKVMSMLDKVAVGYLQCWLWAMRQTWLVRFCMDIFTGIWLMVQFRWEIFVWIKRYASLNLGRKTMGNRISTVVTSSN